MARTGTDSEPAFRALSRARHYCWVYRNFFSTCLVEAASYRLHFLLLIVMDLLFYFSSICSIFFLFNHVETIGAWNRDEFLFFMAFMLAVDQLHMAFVSEAFWEFSFELRTGRLDFALLRPINPLFIIFFRHIRPASVCLTVVPWLLLVWFGLRAGLEPYAWMVLPLLVPLAVLVLVLLEILLSMTMFWTTEGVGINFLRVQLQSLSRWPDFVYRYYFRKVFLILVPVLLVGSGPVRLLIDGNGRLLVGMALAGCVSAVLIGIFWRIGLRRYESASS